MNNVLPSHELGGTIAALMIESMNGEERAQISKVCAEWKNLALRSTAICQESAAKIVDVYTRFYSESLKECFVQPINPEELNQRLRVWGKELRCHLLNTFQNFSQRKLEEYVRDPEKSILEKGQALIVRNAQKITHIGAEILTDIAFMEGDKPSCAWKPKAAAEWVALQEIVEHTESLIAGTIKRMDAANFSNQWEFLGYLQLMENLNNKEVFDGLQSRLIEIFAKSLAEDYAMILSEQELFQLYRLRSQTLYRTIQSEIKRPLQFKAVAWIVIN